MSHDFFVALWIAGKPALVNICIKILTIRPGLWEKELHQVNMVTVENVQFKPLMINMDFALICLPLLIILK